ncbi:MAG TPA: response regulator [Xanthomonadaceae bacterium]|jgi:DNA-binding response OmpR family regulator
MEHREQETTDTTGTPVQQEDNRQAFLRYLPRRIADFERRILRYRFHGWDPNGMTVLAGDAHRLADAGANYGLGETREHLLALAQMVGGHASSLRGPDPRQAERMFALLSAVLRSLPSTPASQPVATEAPEAAPTSAIEVEAAHTKAPAKIVADESVEAPAPPTPVEPIPSATSSEPAAPDAFIETPEQGVPMESAEPEAPNGSGVSEAFTETSEVIAHEAFAEPEESSEPASPEASFDAPPEAAIDADQPTSSVESDATNEPAPPHASAETIELSGTAESEAAIAPGAIDTQIEHAAADTFPDAEPSPAPAAYDDAEDPEAVGSLALRRIFHLSDGNAFATELGQRLEAEGFAVEPVESIDELYELFTCMMPHMLLVDPAHASRLAIIGALRRDTQQQVQPPRHIQMIVMAAQDSMEARRAAYRSGVDLMLFPPFDAGGVADRLKALNASVAAEPVRVLVVDDERADALFAQAVLNRAGMQARVEHDPMRVLEALGSERTDLILMDLHMPFANGVEVTMLIREDPLFARIPIVFLSGESDPDSRLEAINAGGDDFLFKPIRPRHLVTAVQDRVRRLHAIDRQAAAAGDASAV